MKAPNRTLEEFGQKFLIVLLLCPILAIAYFAALALVSGLSMVVYDVSYFVVLLACLFIAHSLKRHRINLGPNRDALLALVPSKLYRILGILALILAFSSIFVASIYLFVCIKNLALSIFAVEDPFSPKKYFLTDSVYQVFFLYLLFIFSTWIRTLLQITRSSFASCGSVTSGEEDGL